MSASGCNGYELTTDLNFDSNGNQQFDAGDAFWNNGKGFEPIGNWNLKFAAEFSGNGYAIYNLTMRRSGEQFTALIGYAEDAYIHDLKLTADIQAGKESGALLGYAWGSYVFNVQAETRMSAPGYEYIAGLIAVADETDLSQVTLKTDVSGGDNSGGLVAQALESHIANTAVYSRVSGGKGVGGFAGRLTQTTVSKAFIATKVDADVWTAAAVGYSQNGLYENVRVSGAVSISDRKSASAGGFIASSSEESVDMVLVTVALPADTANPRQIGALFSKHDFSVYTNVFWAADYAGRTEASVLGYSHKQNFTLNDLRCATNTDACNGLIMINYSADDWDFGGQDSLPTVRIQNASYRDDDADGTPENWPAIAQPSTPDPVDPEPTQPGKDSGSSGGALLWLLPLTLLVRRRR